MKKTMYVGVLALLLMVSSVMAVDYQTDTMDYWKLDGTLVDEAGNYDFGHQSTNASYITGLLGQAVIDDGISGLYAEPISIEGLQTVDFWFYPESSPSLGYWEVYIEADTADTLVIYFDDSLDYEIDLYADATAESCSYADSLTVVEDEWNHFVFTINGTNATAYMNGVEFLNEPCLVEFADNDTYLLFQGGSYDNILLSSASYTASDVTSSYNGGAGTDFFPEEEIVDEPAYAEGAAPGSTSGVAETGDASRTTTATPTTESREATQDNTLRDVVVIGGLAAAAYYILNGGLGGGKPTRARRKRR